MGPAHRIPTVPLEEGRVRIVKQPCPRCGEQVHFDTDRLGRTTVECWTCGTWWLQPVNREPPKPRHSGAHGITPRRVHRRRTP